MAGKGRQGICFWSRPFFIRLKADSRYKILETLADGSAIASTAALKNILRTGNSLPGYLTVRLIKYQHAGGLPGVMLTSFDKGKRPEAERLKVSIINYGDYY